MEKGGTMEIGNCNRCGEYELGCVCLECDACRVPHAPWEDPSCDCWFCERCDRYYEKFEKCPCWYEEHAEEARLDELEALYGKWYDLNGLKRHWL